MLRRGIGPCPKCEADLTLDRSTPTWVCLKCKVAVKLPTYIPPRRLRYMIVVDQATALVERGFRGK